MSKPVCLMWLNDAEIYEQALTRTDVGDRFEIRKLKLEDRVPDEWAERTEVLVGWKPGDYLRHMPRLRWVQAMTAGVEQWLESAELQPDVALTCARGSHRLSMPENILGALFHLTKPFMQIALDARERRWNRRQCGTLAGQTLGILGLGAIGQELARKATALDMHVIGTKRTPTDLPHVARVYGEADTNEVLAASDFVVLLLPATADTENFMDADRLRKMKGSAWLLNFGRGSLIDDGALIAAVNEKTIAGAVLDVFREEPLPASHAFWGTENILVLPHVGGGHPDRSAAVAEIFADNAQRFLAGKPFNAAVDRARGY